MSIMIPGFEVTSVGVADGITLNAAAGGQGPPIVLLHGFPQTHLMWRLVAPILAARHTVVCPDLRGYGASSKPTAAGENTYSKRTMAADIVGLADALGFDRFALVGHDRGALVAFRAGLDATATWRPWVADLQHFTTQAGHFMAEQAPGDVATLILDLVKR